jgi:hypothetical protein
MTRSSSTSLRPCVPVSILSLLLCYLVTYHSASAQEVIHGSFTWPDRGVRFFDDPNQWDDLARVETLAAHTDGHLYVGGYFNYAGDVTAYGISAWDGQAWIDLGPTQPGQTIVTFASHASDLYAGGLFGVVGGVPVSGIARWDGVTWHPLGAGVNNAVLAIEVQQGPEDDPAIVYAGGAFTEAGGMPASRIARWDGTTWSPLGLGCSAGVRSIAIYDDGSGSGPALYATGGFQMAGGIVVNKIAKWDFQTQTWSALGQGITNGSGDTLAVFRESPDPNAPASLFLGGFFSEVDGKPIEGIARWDGQTWSAVGAGLPAVGDAIVEGLRVLNDGSGEALYAYGYFQNGGFLAKWNGVSWARYDSVPGIVYDAEVYNGQLHIGGGLSEFIPKIARFTPDGGGFACGDFDGDGMVTQADLGILLAAFNNCPGPNCPGDANGDGVVDQQDLGILLAHFGQECG